MIEYLLGSIIKDSTLHDIQFQLHLVIKYFLAIFKPVSVVDGNLKVWHTLHTYFGLMSLSVHLKNYE